MILQAGALLHQNGEAAAQAITNLVAANNALQNFKLRDARRRLAGATIDQLSTYDLFSGIINEPSTVLGPNAVIDRDYTYDLAKTPNCTADCPVPGNYFWFDCERGLYLFIGIGPPERIVDLICIQMIYRCSPFYGGHASPGAESRRQTRRALHVLDEDVLAACSVSAQYLSSYRKRCTGERSTCPVSIS